MQTLTIGIKSFDPRQGQCLALKVLNLLSSVVLLRAAKLDVAVAKAVVSVEDMDAGKLVRQEAPRVPL